MNDEKWGDVVQLIEQKFGIIERKKEEFPLGDDFEEEKAKEEVESIVFNGPLGKMMVQRTTRPIVIDKKSHYTKRMGQGAQVEYTYSEDKFSHKLKAFKWDDIANDWVEMEAEKLELT